MDGHAIGLDVGGTNAKAVVVDGGGAVVARASVPTQAGTVGDLIDALRDQVARWRGNGSNIERLGVACPGLPDREERRVAWLPERKLAAAGIDWAEAIPWPRPVPVLNDAHAALLGEAWRGAAAGRRDVAMLTLGTGVGGAILADGRLLRGTVGRAGHLGHLSVSTDPTPGICVTPGSLEEAIADCSLARRTDGRFRDTLALLAAARAGDAEARATWQASIDALARGVASVINALDPELVVIGGGIAAAGDELFVPLRTRLADVEWRPFGGPGVPVVPAALGPWSGAIGAAARAIGLFR